MTKQLVSDARAAQIEGTLQLAIAEALQADIGWDPGRGVTFDPFAGRWEPSPDRCATCAIGMFLMVESVKPKGLLHSDIESAAGALGVPSLWISHLYFSVATKNLMERRLDLRTAERVGVRNAVEVAHRLRDYADELVARAAISEIEAERVVESLCCAPERVA